MKNILSEKKITNIAMTFCVGAVAMDPYNDS